MECWEKIFRNLTTDIAVVSITHNEPLQQTAKMHIAQFKNGLDVSPESPKSQSYPTSFIVRYKSKLQMS